MKRTLSVALVVLTLCVCFAHRAAAQPGQVYSYIINTAIGNYQYGNGGPAAQALLAFPRKLTFDRNGAIYVADTGNHMVRKIVAGQITAIAGTGQPGYGGDGKAATGALLNNPSSVGVDATGNVYIYDTNNEVVRKVDTSGTITTFAGTAGTAGFSGDGGSAGQARLDLFIGCGLAVDPAGDVYIADPYNSVVRKVTFSTGIISTFAGTIRKAGHDGDGGAATAATLYNPCGLALDSAGDLFIADPSNFSVRMVSARDGTISTVAGSLINGNTGDGGPPKAAKLSFPYDVAVDSAGNLYIADTNNNKVRKVTTGANPIISTLAGNGALGYGGDGGPPTAAMFALPAGVAVDSSGTVYIVDTFNNRIRTVNGGAIAEFAGADHAQGDGGKAANALLFAPQRFTWDAKGNMYIADTFNNKIRKVDSDGTMSTIAGNGSYVPSGDGGPATSAGINKPQAVAVDSSGNVFIATVNQIRMVDSHGNISIVVNTSGTAAFSGDGGAATAAQINSPEGLTVDSVGNLYIADTYNHRIRKVSGGTITTIAGNGPICASTCNLGSFGGDGGPATSANLSFPYDVGLDRAGNLLIVDAKNFVIRSVDATSGNIKTIAGTPAKTGFGGDLGPATSALLNNPLGLAVDSSGNIYITDASNFLVRVIDGFGVISTIAGNATLGFSGDGGPAISAQLDYPFGVGVDASGNVWFADTNNHRIRELMPSGPLVPGANAVVNGADFAPGGLVPGGISTVFGSHLTSATGIHLASALPLATQLLNSSVKFNNTLSAPLFAVDNVKGQQQINFQTPWELAGQTSAWMQVINDGVPSLPIKVQILTAQPGIFVALHANFQPVDSGHPATAGEVLVIFCTNLGAVSPPIKDGVAGSGKELTVAATGVTIGGAAATVSYSGLPAGFVGLYQVNAQVPAGLASGNRQLVVSVSGASSTPVQIVVN